MLSHSRHQNSSLAPIWICREPRLVLVITPKPELPSSRALGVSSAARVHRADQKGKPSVPHHLTSKTLLSRTGRLLAGLLLAAFPARLPSARLTAGIVSEKPEHAPASGSVLPGFDAYGGPPIDFGRLEATISDPTVYQQYGMVVGIHNAGQINALSTLNIRGERSVSCRALCDAPPASGPIPASCPKA